MLRARVLRALLRLDASLARPRARAGSRRGSAAVSSGATPADGEAAFHVVHVCVATDQLLPVGLLAVVNSTLHHSCNRSALVFHVVVPPALVARTRILESLFPAARFSIFGMAVNGVAAKLRGRLRALRAGAGAGRDAGRLHGQASAAAAGGGATGGGDGGADDDGGNRQASDESGEAAATAATEAHLYRWAVAYPPRTIPAAAPRNLAA